MYKIILTRKSKTGKAVRGSMTIPFDQFPLKEGEQPFTAGTLENADFIIPAGTYPLDSTWSPKFKKFMPEVQDVPDREGIRIIGVPEKNRALLRKCTFFWGERRTRETYPYDGVVRQSEGFEREHEHSTGCILVDQMTLESLKAFINRINKYTDEKICIEIIQQPEGRSNSEAV